MNVHRYMQAISLSALVFAAAQSGAQLGNLQGQGPGGQFGRQGRLQQRQPAKRNFLPELRIIVDAIAKRTDTKILVDPALFIAVAPKAPSEKLAADKSLDELV